MSEGGKGVETFHTLPGKTRDRIGAYAGVSGRRWIAHQRAPQGLDGRHRPVVGWPRVDEQPAFS
jgi:hypothetical protein